ncbi:MAG: hypothetical protein R3F24_04330 [Gammaproteobacteria bacterium]
MRRMVLDSKPVRSYGSVDRVEKLLRRLGTGIAPAFDSETFMNVVYTGGIILAA